VAERMDDIVHHRNPGDPYRAMPQVRDRLRSKLSREQGANQDANSQSGVNRV